MLSQCPKCNNTFENDTKRTFCSRSCANSRIVTDEHRKKTANTFAKKSKRIRWDFVAPYTKIYLCTCKYSGKQWYSPTVKTVYPDLARTRNEYAYSCRFNFGISKYPKWFTNASELISTYGWYSTPGSRNGIKNTNGISRDHLFSITDGWLNNIDPEIIRHPANCELVPHTVNQSKHKKSKITLDQLLSRIKDFELMYGIPGLS